MEGFDSTPLWDFSQPASLANLADDDFLALLQKQFTPDIGTTPVDPLTVTHNGIDPSKLTNYPIPAPPPPLSEDSSPSPPSVNGESSRRQSAVYSGPGSNEGDEPLKRKASEEDFEEGPSHKAPHLAGKKNPSRRKGAGVSQDESRLLKRKEQNRAAQRAFRERKEKHVKDLEDQVASLEARNELTQTENKHLRELLQRLQDENMMLKQEFTFSVPRQTSVTQELQKNVATTTFNLSPPSSKGTPASSSLDTPSNFPSDIDFGSLTPFDSATMNMVEDMPGIPDNTTSYDFGYGQYVPSKTPYKTIASNPMFMSFADPMLTDVTVANHLNKSPVQSPPSNVNGFDIGAFNTWTTQTQPQSPSRQELTPSHNGSFDEMFGGNLFEPQGPVDFDVLLKSRSSSSLSPVLHGNASRAMTSSSSPSTSTNNTSPPAQSPEGATHSTEKCPKTKAEFARHVASQGDSMFAPQPSAGADPPAKESPNLRKTLEGEHGPNGPMIVCKGATFPLTEKSEKNIEVLSAWRSITSHPQFKASQNIDINELCAEFTDKARCDGTKVVLDPRGISQILEKLGGKKQP
ncbi:hypothetical protein EWM64_g4189 [Hericium alpestre]|uniref:BZIP domain-containing protein n=1 Tax=Hericium alpestre TaxID=135208 RepID=A0A4Z0A0H2_9AGAM|nr:hypothetical protein EWM64_g4189 [Hericium alpestre]